MYYKLLSITAFLISISNSSHATVLIDTGSPALTQNGAITVCNNGTWCQQSVALRVTFNQNVTIENIESWLYVSNQGDLTISLYDENNGLPESVVHSTILSVNSFDKGWYQTTPLSWNIDAGNYWTVFEVKNGQSFLGALEFPAPLQLTSAILNDYYTTWTNIETAGGGGLRIIGEVITTVPEPENAAMLMAGLGLLGFAVRRNKQA